MWTALLLWHSCIRRSPPAGPSVSPPAPGRIGYDPWRPRLGPRTSGTREAQRRRGEEPRGEAWSTAQRSARKVHSRWVWGETPDPWFGDRERKGCSWPIPPHWRANGPPARRCSQCPWCYPTACTGCRIWTLDMARPEAGGICIRIDSIGHSADLHWSARNGSGSAGSAAFFLAEPLSKQN